MSDNQKPERAGGALSWISMLVQFIIALLLVGGVILLRGYPDEAADQLLAIDDAFTVIALLYLCLGALFWVSTTGFFDIFSFAVRRALHAFIPGMVRDNTKDYYEYKEEHKEKRKKRPLFTTFLVGVVLLIVSIALTICWYYLYG